MGQRQLISKLHAAVRPFLQALRGHPWRVRLLFRAQLPPQRRPQYDTTTVALRYALDKWAANRKTALELGVGEAALLSIYLARTHGLRVDGIDISPTRVGLSQDVINVNQASVRVWESDLFGSVDGKYDLIFFNPPYVPTAVGRDLDLTKRGGFDSSRVWDGGPDGTDVDPDNFARTHGLRVDGIDISPILFGSVDGKYDLIFFNPLCSNGRRPRSRPHETWRFRLQ